MSIAASLTPEDRLRLLPCLLGRQRSEAPDRYNSRIGRARNGVFVAKYMGDGGLAYFGYPQAHEHDTERAVRAGLRRSKVNRMRRRRLPLVK